MRWILTAIVGLLLVCAGGGYYLWHDARALTAAVTQDDAASEVRQLVTEFGQVLETVRIDDPFAPRLITEGYGAYVAREQLVAFAADPTTAPGRYAEEVWPERIEIDTVEAINDTNYSVTGRIVYVVNAGGDTTAWLEPVIDESVTLLVARHADGWKIIRYESAGQVMREVVE